MGAIRHRRDRSCCVSPELLDRISVRPSARAGTAHRRINGADTGHRRTHNGGVPALLP